MGTIPLLRLESKGSNRSKKRITKRNKKNKSRNLRTPNLHRSKDFSDLAKRRKKLLKLRILQ